MNFFQKESELKGEMYRDRGITSDHTKIFTLGLFEPLALPDQLRATLLIPLIDLSKVAKSLINLAEYSTEALINFACLSPIMAVKSFANALEELGKIVYFSMSALIDTASALLTLGTKTLGAVANVGMMVGLLGIAAVGLSAIAAVVAVVVPLAGCVYMLNGAFSLARNVLGDHENENSENLVISTSP